MSETLARVRRAAAGRQRAELEYRAAVIAAVDELERQGARDPFAQVARAAGVTRQSVRELVTRSRS